MTQTTTSISNVQGLRGGGTNNASRIAAPPSRWKTRILVPTVIIGVALAILLWASLDVLLPATTVRVEPVILKSVGGSTARSVSVQAPGWLEPDPFPLYATALTDGVVEEVLVLEGDAVEKDQIVARLVDDDARLALQRAEAELATAQAKQQTAAAGLTAAQAAMDNLVERRRTIADAEARHDRVEAELQKLQADEAAAKARLAELEDDYRRKQQLVESRAVSEGVVAQLALAVDAQRAKVEAVAAERPILQAQLRQIEADLHAARQHLELLIEERRDVDLAKAAVAEGEANVQLATARRDEAALRLERMVVRAPGDGVVMQRLAATGSKLTLSGGELAAHVVHIYDPHQLQARVDVPLAEAANVAIGQKAEVVVEVLPDRVFTGTLTRIVHQADIQKNTVEVKVRIEDPIAALKPDMLTRVRFLSQRIESSDETGADVRQRVFAPQNLIEQSADGARVWVVTDLTDNRGRATPRAVTVGATTVDDWIEVESGLNAGDLLISNPPADLAPGDRIKLAQPANAGKGT